MLIKSLYRCHLSTIKVAVGSYMILPITNGNVIETGRSRMTDISCFSYESRVKLMAAKTIEIASGIHAHPRLSSFKISIC